MYEAICDNFPPPSISCVRGKSFHIVMRWIKIQAATDLKICSCLYGVTHSSSWIKQIIWHRRPEWLFLDFPVIFQYRECLIKSRFLSVTEKLTRKKKKKKKGIQSRQKNNSKALESWACSQMNEGQVFRWGVPIPAGPASHTPQSETNNSLPQIPCNPHKQSRQHSQGLFAAPGILVLQHNPRWSKHLFMGTPTTRKEKQMAIFTLPNSAGLNTNNFCLKFNFHLLCWNLQFPHIVSREIWAVLQDNSYDWSQIFI